MTRSVLSFLGFVAVIAYGFGIWLFLLRDDDPLPSTSDAVVVTLQKSSSTAIYFCTLKAFVGKKLTMIPACNVHR